MTREEALAIYDAGPEAAVRALLETDARATALERQVQDLTERLAASELRVRHLEDRLAKDSHNSSKPPSSDGLNKPKPKSLRTPSGRPTGGQPGHAGRTLRLVEKPDAVVSHPVNQCAGCGCSLTEQAPDRVERRQVFDLPEPKLEVTEHRAEIKTCACGCLNRAAFPPAVTAPVQYGLRVKSVAVYLKEYQLLPFERLAEIMRDLFACGTFSEGTLTNFSADCSRRLEPVEELIRAQATAARPRGHPGGLRRNRHARHRLAALAAHRLNPLSDLVLRPRETRARGHGRRPAQRAPLCRSSGAAPSTTSGTPT